MIDDEFEARYQAADGYVGKNRTIYFSIHESEIEDDMDDEDLKELYNQSVQEDFKQTVSAEGENETDFLEWAAAVREARHSEDGGAK